MSRPLHANGSSARARPPAASRHKVPGGIWWESPDTPTASSAARRPRIPREARIISICLAVTAALTIGLRQLWPEVALAVAIGVGGIFFAGLALWWVNRSDSGAGSTLGAALLGGTLVAVGVFGIQTNIDEGRRIAAERKTLQQTLRLTLGIQQDLRGIDLAGQDLATFHLPGKDLSEAVLADADLTRANLEEAKLTEADLSGADLDRADLSGADLSGANLSDARLARADAFGASLSGANLSGADLSGGFLASANLSSAVLVGADLSGADLSGARLSGAVLRGAVADGATVWPVGYDWHAEGVTRKR